MQEVHEALEDVHLEHHGLALGGSDLGVRRREFLHRFHVLVELEIQTALQFSALTGQLAWVQGQLLVAGRARAHRPKVLEPRGATQFSSTHPDAADACCLLAGSDLAHVDADVEGACQLTNQVAEIHALLGRVVERGARIVALVLHIGELHADAQTLDDLTGFAEGVLFALTRRVPQGDVVVVRFACDALQLVVVLDLAELQLALDQFSCQAHHAHIVAGLEVDDHHVSHVNGQGIGPTHVGLAVVFEAQFHDVVRGGAVGQGNAFEPVKHRHGPASAGSTTPVVLASSGQSICPLAARRTSHASKVVSERQSTLAGVRNNRWTRKLKSTKTSLPFTLPATSLYASSRASRRARTLSW